MIARCDPPLLGFDTDCPGGFAPSDPRPDEAVYLNGVQS